MIGKLNKIDAENMFFDMIRLTDDIPRNKIMWTTFIDQLHRDNTITDWQVNNWGYPTKHKNKFLYSYEKKKK